MSGRGDMPGLGRPRPDWSRPVEFGDAYYFSRDCAMPDEILLPAKRPRSARYVASLCWSWGPANSRQDHLFLSMDGRRKFYLLWSEWADDGYSDSRVTAYMRRGGIDSTAAARALVMTTYLGEREEYGEPDTPWNWASAGLLSTKQLARLSAGVWTGDAGDLANQGAATRLAPELSTSERACVLDTLTLAEVILTREAHRALSAPIFGVGNAFLRTARAVRRCTAVLTGTDEPAGDPIDHRTAVRDAADALTNLEAFLPKAPGRFSTLWRALRLLGASATESPRS